MKLPANCPHRRSARDWSPTGKYAPPDPCCRRGHCDLPMFFPEQGPLCRNAKTTIEEYRFVWISSFDGKALVHVSRAGKNVIVYWARSSYTHGNGRFWTCIDPAGWDRLAAAVIAAGSGAQTPKTISADWTARHGQSKVAAATCTGSSAA
jgi:hypothetical protein